MKRVVAGVVAVMLALIAVMVGAQRRDDAVRRPW
jgi:hypothetical protein